MLLMTNTQLGSSLSRATVQRPRCHRDIKPESFDLHEARWWVAIPFMWSWCGYGSGRLRLDDAGCLFYGTLTHMFNWCIRLLFSFSTSILDTDTSPVPHGFPCVCLALQTAETVLLKLTGFQLAFVMEAGGGSAASRSAAKVGANHNDTWW